MSVNLPRSSLWKHQNRYRIDDCFDSTFGYRKNPTGYEEAERYRDRISSPLYVRISIKIILY